MYIVLNTITKMSNSKLIFVSENIGNRIIERNNGWYNNVSNRCGIISIGQAMGCDPETLANLFQIKDHEQLDFENINHRSGVKLLCELTNSRLSIHMGVKLTDNLIRIWKEPCYIIGNKNGNVNYDVQIVWYGNHFEFMRWKEMGDMYPDFDKNIYEQLKNYEIGSDEKLFLNYVLHMS